MAHTGRPALFDTHTHLNVEAFDRDRSEAVARAGLAGVGEMLVVGFDLPSSAAAIRVAQEYNLYATVGIQPHYAGQTGGAEIEQLRALAQQPRVVALGEIGLDYYRNRAPHPDQQRLLRVQLILAHKLGLPVIIHGRDAYDDLLKEFRSIKLPIRGVMHCYSGTVEDAQRFVELGYYISIAGPVTYPKAAKAWEVARQVPLDRLVLETDCPWLAPQAHRGKRNEPAFIADTAARIAELRGLSLGKLAEETTRNARTLFLSRG